MNQTDLLKELNKIFIKVFKENIELTPEMTAQDIDGWDSLKHIDLITTIEKELNVKFKMKEVLEMTSVKKIVEIILSKRDL